MENKSIILIKETSKTKIKVDKFVFTLVSFSALRRVHCCY